MDNSKNNIKKVLLEFNKFEQNFLSKRDNDEFSIQRALEFRPPWSYLSKQLIPPFTYLGGKRDIADEVWRRFGHDIANYIEPFAGGLSVLLARPINDIRDLKKYRELANDSNLLLLNFWRTIQQDDIEKLISTVDFPPHEVALLSRRKEMIKKLWDLYEKLLDDKFYDSELAGYWLYIAREWIGNRPDDPDEVPEMKMVRAKATGFLGESLEEHLTFLQSRTKDIRFFAGYWRRPLISDTQSTNIGTTGVFLDPPYLNTEHYYGGNPRENTEGSINDPKYKIKIADEVREWAIEYGELKDYRIAYCGYEHQHDGKFPENWSKCVWKNASGYKSQKKDRSGNEVPNVETVWFSPNCLAAEDKSS